MGSPYGYLAPIYDALDFANFRKQKALVRAKYNFLNTPNTDPTLKAVIKVPIPMPTTFPKNRMEIRKDIATMPQSNPVLMLDSFQPVLFSAASISPSEGLGMRSAVR